MEYIVRVKLPDNLLNQAERAAASLGMSADDYLRIALEEKVRRWAADEERQQMMDAGMKDLLVKRHEVYRRLAQGPEAVADERCPKPGEGE